MYTVTIFEGAFGKSDEALGRRQHVAKLYMYHFQTRLIFRMLPLLLHVDSLQLFSFNMHIFPPPRVAVETTTQNLRSRRHRRRKVHRVRSRHSTRGRTTMTTCSRPFCTERTRTMPPCDQQAHLLPPRPHPRAPKHATQTRKKGDAASSHSRRVHGGDVNDYHCSCFK